MGVGYALVPMSAQGSRRRLVDVSSLVPPPEGIEGLVDNGWLRSARTSKNVAGLHVVIGEELPDHDEVSLTMGSAVTLTGQVHVHTGRAGGGCCR